MQLSCAFSFTITFLSLLLFNSSTGVIAAPDTTSSPFTGKYSGPFKIPVSAAGGQEGTFTVTVARDGSITGAADNTTAGIQGTLKGSVSADGDLDVTLEFPGQTFTLKGTVALSKAGNFRATIIQYDANAKAVAAIETTLKPGK